MPLRKANDAAEQPRKPFLETHTGLRKNAAGSQFLGAYQERRDQEYALFIDDL
jgi:hypothetical protein